jgi:hypothetical protein
MGELRDSSGIVEAGMLGSLNGLGCWGAAEKLHDDDEGAEMVVLVDGEDD